MHGNRTIWDSYLYYIHDQCMNTDCDRKTMWLLISNGARQTEDRAVSARGEHDDAQKMLKSHNSAFPLLIAGRKKARSTENMTNGLRGLGESKFRATECAEPALYSCGRTDACCVHGSDADGAIRRKRGEGYAAVYSAERQGEELGGKSFMARHVASNHWRGHSVHVGEPQSC